MSALITGIGAGSPAEKAGIRTGDRLLSINGHEIDDVLDYRFYAAEKRICVRVARDGVEREFTVRKGEYEDPGMEFETYLMDSHHSCRNNCIFCFVDQMPPGMRESLYFKDDDARLSFLFGNYITLTALSEKEIQRIIDMHISPVNISVHTTNPELRVKMMRNRFAGESLKIMDRFYGAGIKMNCQIVVCPGYNDGAELIKTVRDLAAMYPCVESIACVPVGLTGYREGLTPLRPFDKSLAVKTLNIIEELQMEFYHEKGSRIVYPSDEFYLLAERELPGDEWFEEYPQLENGVGMLTLFEKQFDEALESMPDLIPDRNIAVATGEAAAGMINGLVDKACKKWHNLRCRVFTVKNEFFGGGVTVTGLITATDIIKTLSGSLDGQEELLISESMLRHGETVFLDDISVEELEGRLSIRVVTVENDGAVLAEAFAGAGNGRGGRE